MKKRDLLLTTFEFLLNSRSHAENARMAERWPDRRRESMNGPLRLLWLRI